MHKIAITMREAREQDLQGDEKIMHALMLAVPSLWFLLLRESTGVFTPIPGNLLRTALLSLPQCQ